MPDVSELGSRDKCTTVFYLLRRGNHPRWWREFIRSITIHPAGAPFDLVILAKGGLSQCAFRDIEQVRAKPPDYALNIRCHPLSDDGYDIHAYLEGVADANSARVLFFNSYSRILGDRWLEIYERGFNRLSPPSLVGATGSFEIVDRTTPFPNVHLRTNGIMMSRKFCLSLLPPAKTRLDCQRFEAGPHGLTKQITDAGGGFGIVTRSGRLIDAYAWPDVPVFRVADQQELLVADNRTHDYAIASLNEKKRLALRAWGSGAKASPSQFLERVRGQWIWYKPSFGDWLK